ncbi:MAG: argininosuccinate lyase [Planctomycetota bacterium]|nr:MAG: argininosuccinate lyase [Planctomycetota bacterium]
MAIWSKGDDSTDALVHAFTVGDDWLYDRHLAPYDLLGCIAHAQMLGATGIIPTADAQALVAQLRILKEEFDAGQWTVEATDEDVHSRIEALLIERLGEPGKRLHTGRSRNDQVLTASRLWLKDHLCTVADHITSLAQVMLEQAQKHEFVPLPGYTHLQRGMPASLGMFFGAHATALLDNVVLLEGAWRLADRCPLGSGASYGVGLPLDRDACAQALGFAEGGAIALSDANSRGKVETAALDACGAVLNDLSRFAADVIFFVSAEAGFLRLGKGLTTGSSIMPQKRNPDIFELLRGRAARFLGLRSGLYAMTLGLHSGYSRDLQDTKPLLIDGVTLTEQALAVVHRSVPDMHPVPDRIEAALTPDLYATDEAYRLVREQGMSFREAYIQVGRNLDAVTVPKDHAALLRERSHAGSTGCLGLQRLLTQAHTIAYDWQHRRQQMHSRWQALLKSAE